MSTRGKKVTIRLSAVEEQLRLVLLDVDDIIQIDLRTAIDNAMNTVRDVRESLEEAGL